MKTYKVTVEKDGTTRWYNEYNELHREDGPALEHSNGEKHWYLNGKHHREDGPAVEYFDGEKHWYLNGKRHREDGPALERIDGTKAWYLNGKRHREDGPALINKYWYLNGKQLTEEEFNNRNKPCIGKKVVIDGVKYTLK